MSFLTRMAADAAAERQNTVNARTQWAKAALNAATQRKLQKEKLEEQAVAEQLRTQRAREDAQLARDYKTGERLGSEAAQMEQMKLRDAGALERLGITEAGATERLGTTQAGLDRRSQAQLGQQMDMFTLGEKAKDRRAEEKRAFDEQMADKNLSAQEKRDLRKERADQLRADRLYDMQQKRFGLEQEKFTREGERFDADAPLREAKLASFAAQTGLTQAQADKLGKEDKDARTLVAENKLEEQETQKRQKELIGEIAQGASIDQIMSIPGLQEEARKDPAFAQLVIDAIQQRTGGDDRELFTDLAKRQEFAPKQSALSQIGDAIGQAAMWTSALAPFKAYQGIQSGGETSAVTSGGRLDDTINNLRARADAGDQQAAAELQRLLLIWQLSRAGVRPTGQQ